MSSGDLKDIFITSGVNERFEGFLTVSINGGDLLGQLSPKQVRAMALQWLEAAEAAESDSLIFKVGKSFGIETELCAALVAKMREFRD